jgi:hypothetical protein
MNHFYIIWEKNGKAKAKAITVLRGKRIALSALNRFAARTSKELYLQDFLSHKVIASRNA